jgi:hypothetical protein
MSQIKLKHSGGNGVIIAAPSSNPASDVTFTLPSADGSASQVIKTDASGNLSFGTKGKILSRASSTMTNGDFAVTGTTGSINTDLNTSITLSNANNKVLVVANLRTQIEGGSNNNTRGQIEILRDSTDIDSKFFGYFHVGGSSKNIYQEVSIFMFDAPADTSQHTYRIKGSADASGVILRILEGSSGNRSSYLHCMEFEA